MPLTDTAVRNAKLTAFGSSLIARDGYLAIFSPAAAATVVGLVAHQVAT